jgi:hypothetical protein
MPVNDFQRTDLAALAGLDLPIFLTRDGRPAAALAQGPSEERALIISMAKAGTYFVGAVLSALCFVDTHLHLWETGLHDYRWKTIDQMVRDYLKFEIALPIERSAGLIRPGQFAVGHLRFEPPARQAARGLRRLFVVRDLRDCLISLMRWFARDGRGVGLPGEWRGVADGRERMAAFLEAGGHRFIQELFYAPLAGWAFEPRTLRIDYETLAGDRGPEPQAALLARLADHVGVRRPSEATSFVERVKGTPTKTASGERSSRDTYWSAAAERCFLAQGGGAVQRLLDAEPVHHDLRPIGPIVGTWRWVNGDILTIGADGTTRSNRGATGEVVPVADGGFAFLWDEAHFVDLLHPADGEFFGLQGVNNLGRKILVVRAEGP